VNSVEDVFRKTDIKIIKSAVETLRKKLESTTVVNDLYTAGYRQATKDAINEVEWVLSLLGEKIPGKELPF
jgi:hypothetical protein